MNWQRWLTRAEKCGITAAAAKAAHSLPGTRSTGLKKCVGFDIPLEMPQGLGIMVGLVRTPNKMVHISSYFSGAQFEEIKIYTKLYTVLKEY